MAFVDRLSGLAYPVPEKSRQKPLILRDQQASGPLLRSMRGE